MIKRRGLKTLLAGISLFYRQAALVGAGVEKKGGENQVVPNSYVSNQVEGKNNTYIDSSCIQLVCICWASTVAGKGLQMQR